ncbi:MAG: hypothetical protein AAGH57_08990 [Pseudomonadota bacterium]
MVPSRPLLNLAATGLVAALALAPPVSAFSQDLARPIPKAVKEADFHLLQLEIEYDPEALEDFKYATEQIQSCEDARELAQTFPAKAVENKTIRLEQLPEAVQRTLSRLPTGQATPPFGRKETAIRVLVICERYSETDGGAEASAGR